MRRDICRTFDSCVMKDTKSGCYNGKGELKDDTGICPDYSSVQRENQRFYDTEEDIGKSSFDIFANFNQQEISEDKYETSYY